MKKLMAFAAVAACGAAFAAVESSNIVGYSGVATENHRAPLTGAVFFQVGSSGTYDLSMLSVPEVRDGVGDLEDYWDPYSENLRVLDPDSSATTIRYTYVSYGFLEDNVAEPDECKWAIGWWVYDKTADYAALIEDGNSTLQVKTAVPIVNGTGFLGSVSNGHSINLVSNGEVPTVVTQFATGAHRAPLFINYLPVSIDLSDMTIPEVRDGVGDLEDYWDPYGENLRVLDPDSSATTIRYTYVSYGFLEDNVAEPDECLWAIGWWVYDKTADYAELIEGGDSTLQVKSAVSVASGSGFLGSCSNGHSINIVFPSATAVPSAMD